MDLSNGSSVFQTFTEMVGISGSGDPTELEYFPTMSENITQFENTTLTTTPRDELIAKIRQSVLALIFILTLAGNFLVIIGIYFRKQKMTRMYYFILHLSIADLTTAFFNVLTQLFWEITYKFQGGPFMCKFVKYTQILGPYASSYILVMTALDRWMAICYPLSNCSWTARRSKLMLGTAWLLSFLCCLPQLYIFSYQETPPGSEVFDCWGTFAPNWGEKAYITWYCITVFIIPLIILIFAYSCITRVIWLNFSMKNAIMQEQRPSSKVATREDSEEADEHEFDHSIEENDDSVFQNNGELGKQALHDKRIYKDFANNAPKNLEVSWHQNKSGIKTTTFMSSSSVPSEELSLSITSSNNKCQHRLDTLNSNNSSGGENPRYFGKETEYFPSSCIKSVEMKNFNGNNIQCVSSYDTAANYIEQNVRPRALQTRHSVDDKLKSDSKDFDKSMMNSSKRHTWRSVSMSAANNAINSRKSADARRSNNVPINGASHKQLNGPSLSLLSPAATKSSRGNSSTKSFSSRPSTVSQNQNQNHGQPRTHSVKGISRAKIKTVKLTITVICMHIICNLPFMSALLWMAYDPYAKEHPFFYGLTFAILTLLASLNSCANSWIVLFFNPNLLQSFVKGTCGRICPSFGKHSPGGPNSINVSQRQNIYGKKFLNQVPPAATSVTGLSPMRNRLSHKEYSNNRSKNGNDTLELIPSASEMRPTVITTYKTPSLPPNDRNYIGERRNKDNAIPIETSFIGI